MILDRCESSDHATTCWHSCPVCNHVRMTSDPKVGKSSMTLAALKDEDRGFSAEPDTLQPESQYGFAAYMMT